MLLQISAHTMKNAEKYRCEMSTEVHRESVAQIEENMELAGEQFFV
jgi:hypothetical protein